MKKFDISRFSEYREHNQLEAKKAKGGFPNSFWETYSAFANTDGGIILLGVKEMDDGRLIPEDVDVRKLKADLWNMVNNRQKISANILTENMVNIETVDGLDILVVHVPRAERTARPVYVGMDPKSGTYRRNHEGDYHCSLDEMSLMFRDASYTTQDSKVLNNMDLTVFCYDTVKRYRNFFSSTHINHLWNNDENEVFLRKIGAVSIGNDGKYHPTAAGLLMFGYEYEITREFPNYFLDYQENRSFSITRWTDRIVSISGDWSGNIFDFILDVLRRMQDGLKVPFVMRGNFRIDDTPIHKLLREAVTNMCVHADYYGRQGLVIHKSEDGYKLENPGTIRIAVSDAIGGGISDPRNGIMLKIFSLIDFGERAGSGLNGICKVWEAVFHTPVKIEESHKNGVDRTTLTLSNGGNTQDVEAMLDFYGNEYDLLDQRTDPKRPENPISDQKTDPKRPENPINGQKTDSKRPENPINGQKTDSKRPENPINDQKRQILELIRRNPTISRMELAKCLGLHNSSIKRRLEAMVTDGYINRVGSDKGGYWEVIKPIP